MYKKFKQLDLITVYSTMMATSGKPSTELQQEIDHRYGMDCFQQLVALKVNHPEAYAAIEKEVIALTTTDTDDAFVRKLISTELLPAKALDHFVASIYAEQVAKLADQAVNASTISKAIIAALAACIPAAICWWAIMQVAGTPVMLAIPLVFMAAYFVVQRIAQQSYKNPAVLLATFVAGFAGLAMGHLVFVWQQ